MDYDCFYLYHIKNVYNHANENYEQNDEMLRVWLNLTFNNLMRF